MSFNQLKSRFFKVNVSDVFYILSFRSRIKAMHRIFLLQNRQISTFLLFLQTSKRIFTKNKEQGEREQ